MKGCLHTKRGITGSVQSRHGDYYLSLNLYVDGKRKPKMINTGLSTKGYNKKSAEQLLNKALFLINEEHMPLEYVMDMVEGDKYKNRRKKKKCGRKKKETIPFIRPNILAKFSMELPDYRVDGKVRERVGTGKEHQQVAEYFEMWLVRAKQGLAPNTFEGYTRIVDKRIAPYFKLFDITIGELDVEDVQTFYDYCLAVGPLDGKGKDELSPSSLRRIHSTFHKGLNDAVKRRTLKYNPATNVVIAPNAEYIPQYHSGDQLEKLLEASTDDIMEIIILLCARYGVRRSEALGLKESALYFEENRIHIRHTIKVVNNRPAGYDITKGKKSNRFLPMAPDVKERLLKVVKRHEELRAEFGPNWNPEGYLCVWDDGRLINPNYATKNYKRIAKKANVPINRLHDTRHSIGALSAQNDVPTRTIQGLLGHADIKMTEKYTQLNDKPLESAVNIIMQHVRLPEKHAV